MGQNPLDSNVGNTQLPGLELVRIIAQKRNRCTRDSGAARGIAFQDTVDYVLKEHGFTGCGNTRRLPFNKARSVRARLEVRASALTAKSRRELREGVTGCGKTPPQGHEASGHDFSRAVSVLQDQRGFSP